MGDSSGPGHEPKLTVDDERMRNAATRLREVPPILDSAQGPLPNITVRAGAFAEGEALTKTIHGTLTDFVGILELGQLTFEDLAGGLEKAVVILTDSDKKNDGEATEPFTMIDNRYTTSAGVDPKGS
ncbi:hypothetical protein EV385_5392 [Krasilnikovia cinnamomea]|uniref:Uncharacterized protein n=1 Tax=Krasilnikovia cinnamomea TaxID=349313 RepID=A0A4Q7ZSI2_9ACTN|nr:hypothetical protein [Krasilnikovia cinnamomea]RZU53465.1 hypothetical protein EV385_5392 [Krasilnikovia cinnamomea]